jgi:uncharacterized protein (TIGR00251 family)
MKVTPEARITIRTHPAARRTGVIRYQEGVLHIGVTAPATGGKANQALVDFLSDILEIPKREIEIERGATSRNKLIRACGLTADEVIRRINSGL